ncbi:MAG: hypothetical protein Ct9H90mP22_7660 [Gammaproteobacteria bacterium]|nr:MAG: hypothetical protein Ct9H90mP22_7660 [Gammaproteobacteria bacterium]
MMQKLQFRSSTNLTKEIIEKANNLKIIARCGVGVDNIDVSSQSPRILKLPIPHR